MFKDLKKSMEEAFALLILDQTHLFSVDVEKEFMWQLYLDGFDADKKQEHNCNSCKSFIRQYGNVVAIKNNKIVSIWDFEAPEIFKKSIKNLKDFVEACPIRDVFYAESTKAGNDNTVQVFTADEKGHQIKLATPIIWNHFYLSMPQKFVMASGDSRAAQIGAFRDNRNVFARSLEELTTDSVETVIELIAQGSLYRGDEFKGLLVEFLKYKKLYEKVTAKNRNLWCWSTACKVSGALAKIRNTSIGTLLIDLSEGKELDYAVAAFERVVAPTNYKRPTALVTKKMIEEAEKTITTLGYLDSLGRRYASAEDISVDKLIFVDRDAKKASGVFAELKEDVKINPKTLSKVEEISSEDFLKNVLPTAQGVEVLLEKSHFGNLASIITAKDPDAPSLFKWGNPFSWCYSNAVTDSIKENVKAGGGKVDGILRFSIQWNEDGKSIIDLDAHAHEPGVIGQHIYYSSYRGTGVFTPMSGNLDVDMINPKTTGVENITWSNLAKMGEGDYRFRVKNFSGHTNFDGVRCEIEFDGQTFEFSTNKPFLDFFEVATVNYSKKNGFTIKSVVAGKSEVRTATKWGMETNKFHKVRMVMNSPNYWNGETGNKHIFFIVDGAHNDEQSRGFFNEFLKEELYKEKRVFEVLGSKLKVEDSEKQLSGLGFSSTQRNSVVVKVKGKFDRLLKINF